MRQPTIPPLPRDIDLSSQTALVTGATSGIGASLAHSLLSLNLSTLILPVRNMSKGEETKATLQKNFTEAVIHVVEFDAEDLSNIKSFVAEVETLTERLDIVYLNAGVIRYKMEITKEGHERNIQVNYLANVLLTTLLLPILSLTAKNTKKPSRLVWTSSSLHRNMSTLASDPPAENTPVVKHLSTIRDPGLLARNANSKILGIFWLRHFTRQMPGDSNVIITSFCPGTVRTNVGGEMPTYVKVLVDGFKRLYGRDADTGARVGVYAGLTTGKETHGEFYQNNGIEEPASFVVSHVGKRLETDLWNESLEFMRAYTDVPHWAKEV